MARWSTFWDCHTTFSAQHQEFWVRTKCTARATCHSQKSLRSNREHGIQADMSLSAFLIKDYTTNKSICFLSKPLEQSCLGTSVHKYSQMHRQAELTCGHPTAFKTHEDLVPYGLAQISRLLRWRQRDTLSLDPKSFVCVDLIRGFCRLPAAVVESTARPSGHGLTWRSAGKGCVPIHLKTIDIGEDALH